MPQQRFVFLAVLLLVLLASCIFLPCIGRIMHVPGTEIYWLRFHRTALALVAGSGLALSGLVFQAMFRNPLATPYTLGIASGAAFGAALCLQTTIRFGLPSLIGFGGFFMFPAVSLGAFLGATLAMGIVLTLARRINTSNEQMLLAGVAVNFFFASLIVLIQYLSSPHDAFQILRWTMGGVQNATFLSDWLGLLPLVVLFAIFLLSQARTVDVFVTGNDRARSL